MLSLIFYKPCCFRYCIFHVVELIFNNKFWMKLLKLNKECTECFLQITERKTPVFVAKKLSHHDFVSVLLEYM